ncbi:MAG: DUF1553 domain-containing protein [Spirochaetota bacterium]
MKNAVLIILSLIAISTALMPQGKKTARKTETAARYTPKIYKDFAIKNRIDELVLAKLEEKRIKPAEAVNDETFLRRVYLDITGTIPQSTDVRKFLDSTDQHRREKVVDALLASEEHIDYLTMKWLDLLRVRSEFPINLWPNAVQAYHRWIREAVVSNMAYDRFARELITASGVNFRDPPVNFYRAIPRKEPLVIAQAVALTFLGARTDKWPKDEALGFAAFFSKLAYKSTMEWKEEIIYYDPDKKPLMGTNGVPVQPLLPDGTKIAYDMALDPRMQFADWLITPENPWFAKAIVNRVWYWYLGRGIIHEPDDIRDDNPPANAELLAWLEKDFIAHKYDMKYLIRQILNSGTYQLASKPAENTPTNDIYFSRYYIRRIDAEVIIDALCRITGTTESYSSPVPEPFTYIPEDQTSVRLNDGSITSSFLEMFGRPSRDSGAEMERNNRPSAAQELHLLNSSHVQDKLRRSTTLRRVLTQARTPEKQVEELYLSILSRFPTAEEKEIALEHMKANARNNDGIGDIAWALVNASEFILKH